MAVSMNAGGYMRSDFMISDAAIPMRLEELDEKAAGFAELLSPTAKAADAQSANSQDIALPESVQKLAEKIAEGELQLEQLPKELVTEELLKAVIAVKKPKPEKAEEVKTEAEATPEAAQLAAGFVSLDISNDRTAELSEITAAFAAEPTEPTAVKAVDTDKAAVNPLPEAQAQVQTQQAQAQQTQPKQADAAEVIPTENTAANEAVQAQAIPQAQTDVTQLTAQQTEVLNRAAENGELSEPTVKKAVTKTAQTEQPEQPEKTEAPAAGKQTALPKAAQDKTDSVAEELAMLKNARAKNAPEAKQQPAQEAPEAKPDSEPKAQPAGQRAKAEVMPEKAQTAPEKEQAFAKPGQAEQKPPAAQTIAADEPIVFRRENGEQVEVRPTQVTAQVTAKLIDTAKELTEEKTEYSLVLNPEELGKITVKLTKNEDGAVSVTIAAENARTQRILEQHSELMQSNLKDSGVRLESWQTVNDAQQDAQPQDFNGSSKNPYHRQDSAPNGEDADDATFAEIMASM